MGNRAVLHIGKEYSEDNIGIYLHWNGGRDSVEDFLEATRKVMGDRLGDEQYGTARLIQSITTFIPGNLSVGIDLCRNLDQDNYDNGVYLINPATMEIVGRKFFNETEQSGHEKHKIANIIIKRLERMSSEED